MQLIENEKQMKENQAALKRNSLIPHAFPLFAQAQAQMHLTFL